MMQTSFRMYFGEIFIEQMIQMGKDCFFIIQTILVLPIGLLIVRDKRCNISTICRMVNCGRISRLSNTMNDLSSQARSVIRKQAMIILERDIICLYLVYGYRPIRYWINIQAYHRMLIVNGIH